MSEDDIRVAEALIDDLAAAVAGTSVRSAREELLARGTARLKAQGAQEEREAIFREMDEMPQPTTGDGYSPIYIEGWKAALSQLSRRIVDGKHREDEPNA